MSARIIPLDVVRRLNISRQSLSAAPSPPMHDLIRDLGCVQLDPVAHIERSHRLVLFSRLGPYDEAELDRLRWQEKALFEYWAHEASLVLTEDYPIHAVRMRHYPDGPGGHNGFSKWIRKYADELQPLKAEILGRLREGGAISPRDLLNGRPGLREGDRSAWGSDTQIHYLFDYLWMTGQIMVVERNNNQRLWGLAEHFWPEHMPRHELDETTMTRLAVQRAVRALGVAQPMHIKRHFIRRCYPNLEQVLKDLVTEGILENVQVVGEDGPLKGKWYLHHEDVPLLERIQAGDWTGRTVLLSPFDNLICDRDRTEQLFWFYYRIEIYVPRDKRQYGYYVLPILHHDRLIGRIDAQVDRRAQTLRIDNIYAEPGAPGREVTQDIAGALKDLARLAKAARIEVGEVPRRWAGLRRSL